MNGYSSLFRSRWNALIWAAGILWGVYWFAAPSGDEPANNQAQTDVTGAPYSDADVAALKATLKRIQ